MQFKTIASGSKGNCSIVLCDETKLIIDMGISYQALKNSLEKNSLSFDQFTGILITHNHNDHVKGLAALMKKTNILAFVPKAMLEGLEDVLPEDRCVFIDDTFNINDVKVELIHTSHDAPCSVGFIITYNNKSMVYVTDTGYINRKFLNKMTKKDLYLIESNHDEVMLMDGPYPRFLKERVISDKGHLSNTTTAKYLHKLVGENTKYVILAHLSETNNTEELAYNCTKKELENTNIEIVIARQNEESKLFEV